MIKREIAIIVAGGGTGGHLFPAISVVREIERLSGHCKALFIVGRRGRGAEIIAKYGYELAAVDVEGMKGRGWKKILSVLFKLPKSVVQSMAHIKAFGPDIVFGVGGYSAGPVCLAARLKGIPTAIHEQNTIPGFTNRMLAKVVTKVFISFEQSRELLGRPDAVVTGTPIRPEVLEVHGSAKTHNGEFTILVMGGSQGAMAINKAFVEALDHLKAKGIRLRVIHQTGQGDFKRTVEDYRARGLDGEVVPFIEDMAGAYCRAQLVICRAGASTIFELAALRKPAILIPYPFAANRHQDFNAQALADTGGAVSVLEKDLNGLRLAGLVEKAMEDSEFLKYTEAVKGIARPDAARVIAEQLLELAA